MAVQCTPGAKNPGSSVKVTAIVKNTSSMAWTMYIQLIYDTGYGTPELRIAKMNPIEIQPGISVNAIDTFAIPEDWANLNIRVRCLVGSTDAYSGVATAGCDNLITVGGVPTVSAEIISISVT